MGASSRFGLKKTAPSQILSAVLQVYWLHATSHGYFSPLMSTARAAPAVFRAGESWPAIGWSGFQFREWLPGAVVRNGSGSGGNFSPKPEILAPIFGTHTQPFIHSII